MNKLSPEHLMLAREVGLYNATPAKIRELTGYSPQGVSRILNDPLFTAEVDRLTNDISEHALQLKKNALDHLHENIGAIVESQVNIALDEEVTASVRSTTADKLMSYVYPKKDVGADDSKGNSNVMVQLSDETKALDDDGDVNPAVSKNVIDFLEKKQANDN